MEDLTKEELVELVTFYKQRVSDSELNLLQTQLKLKKAASIVIEMQNNIQEYETRLVESYELQKSLETHINELQNVSTKVVQNKKTKSV